MVFQALFLFMEKHWLQLTLVMMIITALFVPRIFKKTLAVEVPAEFHLAAVLFTFCALYLGEIHSFYIRYWWWDIILHTTAGFLSGILGFLLVYLLNESKRVHLEMNPGFIAFFAFIFSVFIGSVWEFFEFLMDQLFGLNMQKPMLGDPSGLTDTMWDMIVNAMGAGFITFTAWRYLKLKENFFVKKWIRIFIERNPHLFKK